MTINFLWRLLCAFIFSLHFVVCWAQTPRSLDLGDAVRIVQSRIPLWEQLQTLSDPEGGLTTQQAFDQMEQEQRLGGGERLPSEDHAYGGWIPHPYWAKFRISNSSKELRSWVLGFESPTQDDVRLFTRTQKDGIGFEEMWRLHPEIDAERKGFGQGQLFPTWRINISPGQEQIFMLRLDGHNRMRFPLYAMTNDAFDLQQRWLSFAIGFILAIPMVLMLFVLTLIRSTQDKSIPLFLVMATSEVIGACWISGQLHAYLPWVNREICGWIGFGAYVVLLGLSCVHAQIFLQTKTKDPWSGRILSALAVLWLLVLPIFCFFEPDKARLCLLMGGTVHALILFVIAVRAYWMASRRGIKTYLALFVTVWAVYLGAGIFYLLYRMLSLPVYSTLMVNFVQGSLVAALLGCAVSVQVIRQKKLVEQAAQRALDRNQLYTAAHHDLWQPIQSIGLQLAALKSLGSRDPALADKYQSNIQSAVGHVHDFVEGLRHLDSQPTVQDIDLDELLLPLVTEYRLLANQKNVSLSVRPSHLVVQSDPVLLQRVVRNLLSNSIRYTNVGGRVLVGVRRLQGQVWLMVYDNGIGMSPEHAKKSFEAFARFGDLNRVPEGMGIGLYSVKRIALRLGLPTKLRSRLGHGTAVGVGLIAKQG